jgi:hypothetical protein
MGTQAQRDCDVLKDLLLWSWQWNWNQGIEGSIQFSFRYTHCLFLEFEASCDKSDLIHPLNSVISLTLKLLSFGSKVPKVF